MPAILGDISYNSTAPFYATNLGTDVMEIPVGGVEPTAFYDPITNTGNTAITPYGFSITGEDAQDFELVGNTCYGVLEPGATCDLDIARTSHRPKIHPTRRS